MASLPRLSRPFQILALCCTSLACLFIEDARTLPGAAAPDFFSICTATLDGKNVARIVSDAKRELNHARVSPDRKWITFTRHNNAKGPGGISLETAGYEKSEIMLCRLDGSDLRSLVPSRTGMVAANGYWTPDGRAILFVTNDNAKRQGAIARVEVETGRVTPLRTPPDLMASDPHQVAEQIVFAVFDGKDSGNNVLWTMKQDGSQARQLTHPRLARKGTPPPLGDFDPKLSPDGRKVATMRQVSKDNWHVVVVDLETGREQDLSPPRSVDGVPEWSGDGKKLIFWHVDTGNLRNSGLYAMSADGSDRQRLPLPHGYFYTMPAFFPDSGSGPGAQIIYSTKREPAL
jgi:Tol biopolymer transport system component